MDAHQIRDVRWRARATLILIVPASAALWALLGLGACGHRGAPPNIGDMLRRAELVQVCDRDDTLIRDPATNTLYLHEEGWSVDRVTIVAKGVHPHDVCR